MRDSIAELINDEMEIRRALWSQHGHFGIYGDDDEMQCGECKPARDFKREPVIELVRAILSLLYESNKIIEQEF